MPWAAFDLSLLESQDSVLSRRPLWDSWEFLLIITACLTIEWLARRYWRAYAIV